MTTPTSHDSFPLPGELVDAILEHLGPRDLARVAQTCKTLRVHAMADRFWIPFILENLPEVVHKHLTPGTAVPLPRHVTSYYHLYVAHEARWFLPKYKLWICGHDMVGKMLVARYDPRRAVIEAYRVLAVSTASRQIDWPTMPNVVVDTFAPQVSLWADQPVIKLEARPPPSNDEEEAKETTPPSGPKITMYRPPAPLSFSQYTRRRSDREGLADDDDISRENVDADAPICPRIRPVFMATDGDNVLLTHEHIEGGTIGHERLDDVDDGPVAVLESVGPSSASSSSFVTNSQLRRQFVYARPLRSNAARGGSTFTPRRQSAGGVAGASTAVGAWANEENDEDGENDDETTNGAAYGAAPEAGFPDIRLPGRPSPPASPLPFPLYTVWPPPAIPSQHRVRGTGISANHYPRGEIGRPRLRSEISDRAFHTRTWMDLGMGNSPFTPMTFDTLETYATIDPYYYTPTDDKIFRGIWVGDYSTHGCEFLLVHQPDDPEPFDPAAIPKRDGETDDAYRQRLNDRRIYRGRLEAIKLTGDPNVPRGEKSFVAPDLDVTGLDMVLSENDSLFPGVRAVRSMGHVAGTGFRNDRFIDARLLLISPDKLAMHWIGFGHVSYFDRVDIDKFVDPMGGR